MFYLSQELEILYIYSIHINTVPFSQGHKAAPAAPIESVQGAASPAALVPAAPLDVTFNNATSTVCKNFKRFIKFIVRLKLSVALPYFPTCCLAPTQKKLLNSPIYMPKVFLKVPQTL